MQNIVFLRSNISAINDQEIHIKGARVHNLKNVEIRIPRDEMVVIRTKKVCGEPISVRQAVPGAH